MFAPSMRTICWITHTFRPNSRLMQSLSGDDVAFVYFSPWHFAGDRERRILSECSGANISLFAASIGHLDAELRSMGLGGIHVARSKDPIGWLREAAIATRADRVVIDEPLFALWHSLRPLDAIGVPVHRVDSDLIGPSQKRSAMGRLGDHLGRGKDSAHVPSRTIVGARPMPIGMPTDPASSYMTSPSAIAKALADAKASVDRASSIAAAYGETRDRADGQTGLSRWFQNGLIDPATVFHRIRESGGEAAVPLLRQLCFRESHIRRARAIGLTMEDGADRWAEAVLDPNSLEHFRDHRGARNSMATLENLGKAMTGDALVDRIMRWSLRNGTMPNRARMFFASWCYRNSATPAESFELCSSVFDLLLLDGQCPTNYVQCAEALQLKYGRVTPFRADTAEAKLWPAPITQKLF